MGWLAARISTSILTGWQVVAICTVPSTTTSTRNTSRYQNWRDVLSFSHSVAVASAGCSLWLRKYTVTKPQTSSWMRPPITIRKSEAVGMPTSSSSTQPRSDASG